jgi:hypothetical protein
VQRYSFGYVSSGFKVGGALKRSMRDSSVPSYTRARDIDGSKTWFQEKDSDEGGRNSLDKNCNLHMMVLILIVVLGMIAEFKTYTTWRIYLFE